MKKIWILLIISMISLQAEDSFKKISCEAVSAQHNGEIIAITERQVKANNMYFSLEYNDYKMKILSGMVKSAWLGTGTYSKTEDGLDYYGFKEQPLYRDSKGNLSRGEATYFNLIFDPKDKMIYVMIPNEEGTIQVDFQCK